VTASVCTRLGDLLARRDEDRLAPSEERLLREHLAACGACAAAALRHDPVLLFVRDAAQGPQVALTAEARERFVGDVLAATGAVRAERRLRSSRTGVVLRLAASFLLAASLAGAWFARGRFGTPEAAPVPVALATEGRPAPADVLPAVEEVGGDGAVVYQFPATSPGEPTVVFVVDRNADI